MHWDKRFNNVFVRSFAVVCVCMCILNAMLTTHFIFIRLCPFIHTYMHIHTVIHMYNKAIKIVEFTVASLKFICLRNAFAGQGVGMSVCFLLFNFMFGQPFVRNEKIKLLL